MNSSINPQEPSNHPDTVTPNATASGDATDDDTIELAVTIDLAGELFVIGSENAASPRPGIISTLPPSNIQSESSVIDSLQSEPINNNNQFPFNSVPTNPFQSTHLMSTPTGQTGYPASTWPLASTPSMLGVPLYWTYVPVRNSKFPFVPFPSLNNYFYVP